MSFSIHHQIISGFPKLSDFGSFNFMRESQTVNAGNPVYAALVALDPNSGSHTSHGYF